MAKMTSFLYLDPSNDGKVTLPRGVFEKALNDAMSAGYERGKYEGFNEAVDTLGSVNGLKWHKGNPRKDGEYLCAVDYDDNGQIETGLAMWKKGKWLGWKSELADRIVGWIAVPPLPKGEDNG